MQSIDFTKGLLLGQLSDSPKSIGFFALQRNSGFSNLQKFPWQLKYIERVAQPIGGWKNMDDFDKWLQESFHRLDDGIYYIIGWSASTRKMKGKKTRVRDYIPFCKFQVSEGAVSIPRDFRKSRRTGKTYRVHLMLGVKREEGMFTKKRIKI